MVILVRVYNSFDENELKKFANDTGCKIVAYELTCNESFYDEYEGIIIDLEYDEDTAEYDNAEVIFTKDYLITDTNKISYKEILTNLAEKENFDVDDAIKFINTLAGTIYTFVFIISFIGGTLFFLLANTLLALVVMSIINSVMKKNFRYEQIYKLTIVTSIPYVAFNNIVRILLFGPFIGSPVTSLIGDSIPYVGFFITIALDYAIIYGLTYWVIKRGYEEPQIVEENNNIDYIEAKVIEDNN